jgi:hypothetical protein
MSPGRRLGRWSWLSMLSAFGSHREFVVSTSPKLVDRSRRPRELGKTDVIDAPENCPDSSARARSPSSVGADAAGRARLKLLVEHHAQLARERTQVAKRVHADTLALLPGYRRLASWGATPSAAAAPLSSSWKGSTSRSNRTLALARLPRVVQFDAELRQARRMIATTLDGVAPVCEASVGSAC